MPFPLTNNQTSPTSPAKAQQPSLAGSPELTLASNPLWHLEFGVKVVVGPSHLTNTDPVLPFERQFEWAPAQAGGQVHDEAHDVRKSNDTHVPAGEKRCQAGAVLLHGCPSHLGLEPQPVLVGKSSLVSTCACPTKQLHSLWFEVRP